MSERRTILSLTFAKRTLTNKKMQHMFPRRIENRNGKRRKTETYKVTRAHTNRLNKSAIPYMQHLLNEDNRHNQNSEAY